MANLKDITNYCDSLTRISEFKDFPGAENGLQIENNGEVTRIGASVDAGLIPFREAVSLKVDLLLCHHGLYWDPPQPLTGIHYRKIKTALEGNLALYSSHLPLDAHPDIGNNALLARNLELDVDCSFLPHEGEDIGLITRGGILRAELKERLRHQFPDTLTCIEFGSEKPQSIAILTGSGSAALDELPAQTDTLITGELKQHHFNLAQERRLNLYLGGHYATEIFGVKALARKVSEKFNIPWEFIDTSCPL